MTHIARRHDPDRGAAQTGQTIFPHRRGGGLGPVPAPQDRPGERMSAPDAPERKGLLFVPQGQRGHPALMPDRGQFDGKFLRPEARFEQQGGEQACQCAHTISGNQTVKDGEFAHGAGVDLAAQRLEFTGVATAAVEQQVFEQVRIAVLAGGFVARTVAQPDAE